MSNIKRFWPGLALLLIAVFSFYAKFSVLSVGAPYITIDDQTAFEGGFLVWFGEPPPQRMYLESWIVGLTALITYVMGWAGTHAHLGLDIVADAYRAYFNNPDPFAYSYRVVSLAMDLATVALVYLLARQVLEKQPHRAWLSVFATGCYLLSYNTIWCDVVARPDIPTALFSMLGTFIYFKSRAGEHSKILLLAAVAFGLAAGLKLHAVFFVIFVLLDLWRIHGLRMAFKIGAPFALLAFVFFCISAGSPLFDPLLYAKLRVLNVKDDASPWIHWGDQFLVMLRGSGWLPLIVMLGGVVYAWRSKTWERDRTIDSLLFLSCCWLLLFCTIRQLRAYWMLPALPLFYIAAAYALGRIGQTAMRAVIAIAVLVGLAAQSVAQINELKAVPYNQLRSWVAANIPKDAPIYILGYESLFLPKSAKALSVQRQGIDKKVADAIAGGESFTMRHIQMWEEMSALALQDMLGPQAADGFTYYSYFGTPLDEYAGILSFDDMQFVLLQDKFSLTESPKIAEAIRDQFDEVTELVGPGGGKAGLKYKVYKRKAAQ